MKESQSIFVNLDIGAIEGLLKILEKDPLLSRKLVERFEGLRNCFVAEQINRRMAGGATECLVVFKPTDAFSDFMAAVAR